MSDTIMAEAVGTDTAAEERGKARQGRVIVRNLIFDMREQHLKKAFGRFGKIEAVDVPLNNSNNQNRGFGFIEFSTKNEALAAITVMHNSLFKGRKITVEFSLPKASYETKVQHVLDNTNQTKQQVIRPKSIKFDPKP
jgi:RNA recognition motif-containing protein